MRDLTDPVLTDGPYSFAFATPDNVDEINRMLAENPMEGRIRVSLEHAPDPFAADFGLSDNHVCVLARDRDGQAVGFCERTTWRAFVNGAEVDLPYLGALRVARAHRGRIRVLRGGFAALRAAERPGEAGFALTSIAEDNTPARRLLTAGVDGLPRYTELGRFVTLFLRARRGRLPAGVRTAGPEDLPRIAAFLNRVGRGRQFAPVWSAERLALLSGSGLGAEDFLLIEDGATLVGCAAIWDQSARRQAVVRGYQAGLGRLRPLANLFSPLIGLPALPAVGDRIPQAAVFGLVALKGEFVAPLLAGLRRLAFLGGIDTLFLGLPAEDPMLQKIRKRMRAVELATRLYAVHWPEVPAPRLDPALPIHPEAGLM
jgi:hypothetical protein